MLQSIDAYARELRQATTAGGLVTALSGIAAIVYASFLVNHYLQQPPTTTSSVQWADTNGPFPMTIKCTSRSGCLVSNVHNRWSSNANAVDARQQRCFQLESQAQYTINFTFTQDPRAGLILVWDPSASDPAETPQSGAAVRADTNCPTCAGGVLPLWTPLLGGVYLANMVLTQNRTSAAVELPREWFVTYVSNGTGGVSDWAPCYAVLVDSQRVAFVQSTVRIMSAWYSVEVAKRSAWLALFGTVGGAVQICVQVGGLLLLGAQAGRAFWLSRLRVRPTEEDVNIFECRSNSSGVSR